MNFTHSKIEIYIPETHLERLIQAINKGGAGVIGEYDNCVSITNVYGYWRPLKGADPYEGKVGEICKGSEVKVEVRCTKDKIQSTINEIIKVHPYEEPVVNIIPLVNHLYIDDYMHKEKENK